MEDIIKKRKIKTLVHFTAVKNLPSILKNGLQSRKMIAQNGLEAVYNDLNRYDDRKLYNCLSIEFPNFPMFYKYYKTYPHRKWCIIGFNINLILELDCLFCFTNAANNIVSKKDNKNFKGKMAFLQLFDKEVCGIKRNERRLYDCFPTDEQAEVLIKGRIDPKYILGVRFDDKNLVKVYRDKYPSISIEYCKSYYKDRDYFINRFKDYYDKRN